jgi:prolyl-tRNA editing enzyme YbaK/EbsC (Cys-tRNA(Pro) deacylase)
VLDAAARKGVELRVVTFGQSTHTAQDAAQAVGAELGQIVKSLVFVVDRDDGPEGRAWPSSAAANTVDLGRLAAVLTEPRIRRATADEARQLTGFPSAASRPSATRPLLRTVMDPDLGATRRVGRGRHAQRRLRGRPATLRMLANAVVAPLAREDGDPDRASNRSGNEEAAGASLG